MSKATLVNMLGRILAVEMHHKGVAVGLVHPGVVKTDMLNQLKTATDILDKSMWEILDPISIDVDESAKGILKRLQQLTMENSGTYWDVVDHSGSPYDEKTQQG